MSRAVSEVPFHIWVAALFTLRNRRRTRRAQRKTIVRITRDAYVVYRSEP